MSHRVMVQFPCHPGKAQEMLGVLGPELADTRSFEGCKGVEMFVDQDDPDMVVSLQTWASRQAQEAYLEWRNTADTSGLLAKMSELVDFEAARFFHLDDSDI